MQIVHTHCAGLDVHKKTVVACRVYEDEHGRRLQDIRTFQTFTSALVELLDWLKEVRVTHAAMESTGDYWKPVFNVLENELEVILVNAHHVKAVPGRKTDVKDSEWLADLLQHGLLRPSFIPPPAQRDLRDLTRLRTNLVRERTQVVQRLHTVLETANIKLTSVATDITGASGRAMLEAIIHEQGDPETMARLAKGKLREKRDLLEQALSGRVRPHHRFLLVEHLVHLDFLDEQIALVSDEIDRQSRDTDSTNEETLSLLDTIPGVGRPLAQTIMAEIGNQVSSFPSAKHLAAWAGLAPGNNESAGKRRPGPIGHGDTWLRTGLVQAAQAASKMRQCYLAAQYHRIAARRGAKRAIIAVAHSIITIIWHMLTRREPYRDLGPDYLDNRNKERNVNRLTRRLEKLGFRVSLEPVTAPATP